MSYMPTTEAAYIAWSDNFIAVVNLHKTGWNIAQERVAEMQALQAEAADLHEKCQTAAGSPEDTRRKNEKIALLKQKEEHLVGQLQVADFMTDDFRQELGITIKDTRPNPRPEPQTEPEMKAELKPPRAVELLYKAPGAKRWGTKDADAVSVEVRWAVLGHAPESIEELTHSAFATSGAVRLEFDLADRGKTVYYMARWLGRGGKHGPWTDIASTIVP
jgi:hypothetical protein